MFICMYGMAIRCLDPYRFAKPCEEQVGEPWFTSQWEFALRRPLSTVGAT